MYLNCFHCLIPHKKLEEIVDLICAIYLTRKNYFILHLVKIFGKDV